MQTENKLKTFEFEITNSDNVSFKHICAQLRATLPTTTPLLPNVPVALTVTYGLNAIAWRPKKFHKPSWHLRLPNASTVLYEANALIVDSGFCIEQQIVAASVVKYPTADTQNLLRIELRELAPPSKEDKPTLQHKVLAYYLEACTAKSKKPTYTEFNNMLKKLRSKNKSKKEKESALLADVLKNFGSDSKITE